MKARVAEGARARTADAPRRARPETASLRRRASSSSGGQVAGLLYLASEVKADDLGHNRVVQLPARSYTLASIWEACQFCYVCNTKTTPLTIFESHMWGGPFREAIWATRGSKEEPRNRRDKPNDVTERPQSDDD